MSDDAATILAGLISIFLLIFFVIGLFFITQWTNAGKCEKKWQSFENKYSYWEGCQINVEGKWIPSSSYYFKQE